MENTNFKRGDFLHKADLPFFKLLHQSDLEAIHEATLQVLADTGLKIYSERAREIYAGAGCSVDHKSLMVKIPAACVNEALSSAPGRVLLAARNSEQDIILEGRKVVFKNFATGVKVLDPYTNEYKMSTKEDLGNIARFCDALSEVDFFTLAVSAQDYNPQVRDLHEAEVVLNNTSKHFSHDTHSVKSTKRFIKMAAAVAGGMEQLRERPLVSLGTCPVSPLELHEECSDLIIEAALAGIPVNILSMGLAGATSPVTMAGTLVVTNAEVLGGIVLAQLVSKGTPVIYGTSNTIMDLIHTTSPVGAPEHAMFSSAVGQLGHFYHIPTDVGGT
jgi:trimethylamine--corrinoid protein Co-methyltransferase